MKDLETIEANIEQLSLPENYEDKLRSIRWLCVETKRLNAEVKRLREALSEIDKDYFSYLKDVRPNDSLTRILQEMRK